MESNITFLIFSLKISNDLTFFVYPSDDFQIFWFWPSKTFFSENTCIDHRECIRLGRDIMILSFRSISILFSKPDEDADGFSKVVVRFCVFICKSECCYVQEKKGNVRISLSHLLWKKSLSCLLTILRSLEFQINFANYLS